MGFVNLVLKGAVDILECIVLKDMFISQEVRVETLGLEEDADADCVFCADSVSASATDEHLRPHVLTSSGC